LIQRRHSYIGVSVDALIKAVEMDYENGDLLGPLTKSLGRAIGGRTADCGSHVQVVVGFLNLAWVRSSLRPCREHAASYLMRQLIRERHDDYIAIIRAVISCVANNRQLVDFLHRWTRGHFIPEKEIWDKR
jgi:hypothetical protein